ncbi:hypothetical protein ACRAQ6_14120 [Erythrobacter sp. HA6-11]
MDYNTMSAPVLLPCLCDTCHSMRRRGRWIRFARGLALSIPATALLCACAWVIAV